MYLDSCFLLNKRTPGSSTFPWRDRLWQRYGGYLTPPARFAFLGMRTSPFVDQLARSPRAPLLAGPIVDLRKLRPEAPMADCNVGADS
jgi:hypothetical protein